MLSWPSNLSGHERAEAADFDFEATSQRCKHYVSRVMIERFARCDITSSRCMFQCRFEISLLEFC